jgi:tetratricopeptide (TPR) repeat protein
MPSYRNYIILITTIIFLVGCGEKNIQILPNEKVFDKEDEYIIEAINYELINEYENASNMYGLLYANSKKGEYKINQIKMAIKSKNYPKSKSLLLQALKDDKDNITYLKLLVNVYLLENNYKQANIVALKILSKEQNKDNYKLVANSFLINNNYDKALIYLEKAYSYDNDEELLDNIVTILYLYKNQKNKAISYLESHLRMIDTDKQVANRLLKIYSSEKDVNGIISVYKLLYDRYSEPKYAKNIVDLYRFKGDKKSLIQFLEKSNYDNDLLINLYQTTQNYKKAKELVKKLFVDTGDYIYLAQEAIFDYETLTKKDKKSIKKITQKLEKSLLNMKKEDAVLYNYLGYLHIDHEIDIKKGIKWVKKALKIHKDSPYYLDSLAWGYYKINYVTKSFGIMKKVVQSLGLEDEEVKKHYNTIKKRYDRIHKKRKK